jgi:hypothetical protein
VGSPESIDTLPPIDSQWLRQNDPWNATGSHLGTNPKRLEVGIHGARNMSTPSIAQEAESEKFEEFKVEAVAGRKYIQGRWMYLVKWRDWQKRSWVWAEDMAGCKSWWIIETPHIRCQQTTHPNKDGKNERGRWEKGVHPLHGPKRKRRVKS